MNLDTYLKPDSQLHLSRLSLPLRNQPGNSPGQKKQDLEWFETKTVCKFWKTSVYLLWVQVAKRLKESQSMDVNLQCLEKI